MKSVDERVDVLERLIEHHRYLSEYVENTFQFEEEFIFPAVLSRCATPNCNRLISELRSEHAMILKGLEEFGSITPQDVIYLDDFIYVYVGAETVLRLENSLRNVATMLSDHAEKEADELLPILRRYADPCCRKASLQV